MSTEPRPTATFASVDELLVAARTGLVRLTAHEAAVELEQGAALVDIRPAWQRAREGEIPGALIIERNHLEWRLHPLSPARHPLAVEGQRWIVVCSEGFTSSLAAAALCSLGLDATDLIDGFGAWHDAGLPESHGLTPVGYRVGERSVDPGQLAGPDVQYEPGH